VGLIPGTGQLKLLISLSDGPLNRGSLNECLKLGMYQKASGIGASFCILHGGEYK
jgi:hypothetical protein